LNYSLNRPFAALAILLCTLLSAACSDSNNDDKASTLGVPGANNPDTVAVPAAGAEGPIPGEPILVSAFIDLGKQGYEQAEYLISGTANAYTNVNELGSDGKWQVQASDEADYKTRIIVIRPSDPEDFNGTVFVEWLNVSAGFDSPPDWLQAHTELMRSGYAWVGVSAQKVGVDALTNGKACDINPLCINRDRYESLGLNHPGDNYSYDIFSQVAQAIREPGEISLLDNLQAQHLIAAGESQSAGRMVTYANAFAPIHALYDGYFIHSRTSGSAGLQQESFCEAEIPAPAVARVRDDLGTPTMMVQTETDLFILGSYASNQDDSENFRLWEIAGTAHADLYTFLDNRFDDGSNPSVAAVVENEIPVNFPPTVIDCTPNPVNSGPQHFVVNAAIRALNTWIVDGTAAPPAERLEVAGEPPAFVKDALGNTRGGIRTPYVDAPIAILEGEGQPQPDFSELEETCEINLDTVNFCFLSGTTKLFDAATLRSLYADNAAYIDALNAATDDAVEKGFLVPEDAALIKANAASSDIFAPAAP
jgi:Alpha/beta hydrolase domain